MADEAKGAQILVVTSVMGGLDLVTPLLLLVGS